MNYIKDDVKNLENWITDTLQTANKMMKFYGKYIYIYINMQL